VTNRRTDRRTEFSSLYRVCITCSAVKTKFIKNGCRRRSCTSKTAKIHRFVIFVMYCIITTVPVAFYWTPICREFATQPNFTEIGIWLGVADKINRTKFGNDRSRDYKVTAVRILACSTWLVAYHTVARLCYILLPWGPPATSRSLANVHVRYMSSPLRLSVCLSSVKFVRPTQAIKSFGNVSTLLPWPSVTFR